MKKKILVVMGGTSKEREISKKSGYACIKALKELGCKVKIFDPKNVQTRHGHVIIRRPRLTFYE